MRTIFTELRGQRRVFVRETSTLGLAQKLLRDIQTDAGLATDAATAAQGARDDALAAVATIDEPTIVRTTQNLADLTNPSTARDNLGLGSSAVLDIGTGSGTVAAGDDARLVAVADKANTDGSSFNATLAASFIEALGLNARLPLIPELYGAVDTSIDPSGDYTAEIEAWFDAARTTGLPLDGRGKTYRVTAATATVAHLYIDNVTLVESNPNTGEPKTLTLTPATANVGSVWIGPNFKIDRNGNGTAGTLGGSYALLIDGVPNVHVEAEVYGNSRGNGIWIKDATRVYERAYVHDMRYAHTSETDDVIQGIYFWRCQNILSQGRVVGLGRIDQTNASRDRYSRGYALSGCRRGVLAGFVERVDQGFDTSGDLNSGNHGIVVDGAVAKNVATWGAKFANTGVTCGVHGLFVDQAGRAAAVISGPASALKNQSGHALISGVHGVNIGTNQLFSTTSVIMIEGSGGGRDPSDVIVTGNKGTSFTGASAFTVHDTDEITLTGYLRIATGVRVRLTTTGTLPSGLATGTDYFIIDVPDTNRIKLASSYINALDGTPITGLSGGSGTHTMTLQVDCDMGVRNDITDRVAAEPNLEWGNSFHGFPARSSSVADAASLSLSATGARGSAQAIPHNTFTTVTYDAASGGSDEYGILTEATGVWIVPKGGVWRFRYRGQWTEGMSAGSSRVVRLETSSDGSSWDEVAAAVESIGATPQNLSQQFLWEARVSSGQQYRLRAYHSDGADLNLSVRVAEMQLLPYA